MSQALALELTEADFLPTLSDFSKSAWAKPCKSPFPHHGRRPTGTKGLGHAYEAAVASALPSALHGQWFTFFGHFCQPDLILRLKDFDLVCEVKLTDKGQAQGQLQRYLSVVANAFHRPTRGIIIARNLSQYTILHDVVGTLAEGLHRPASTLPILHAPWPKKQPHVWELPQGEAVWQGEV